MNKEELQKYINGLSDDTEIIVVTTKEQASVIPRHCERIDFKGKAIYLLRQFRKGVWVVAVAWLLQSVELLPKPEAVFLTAVDKIEYVLEKTDWNFPYTSHDTQYPQIAFESNGTTHFMPPSGLSPQALEYTGSAKPISPV